MQYQELILDMLNRIVKLEKEVELLKGKRVLENNLEYLISTQSTQHVKMQDSVVCCYPMAELEKNAQKEIEARNKLETIRVNEYKPRDKTRYMFNGYVYLKNKLVLAIVKDYVSKNQKITCNELKTIFDKSLQGSIGVVEYESIARQRKDYQVRFFANNDEILRLVDGNMLVCSQWGILNISNFIKRAEQLGYKIEQISRE